MNIRFDRRLYMFAVLAMLMHFMAQITPLWMPAADGQTIQICTTQGVKTIALDENGNEIPPSPLNPAQASHNCAFCLAHATSPLSPNLLTLAFLPPPSWDYVRFNRGEEQRAFNQQQLYGAHLTRGPPAQLLT